MHATFRRFSLGSQPLRARYDFPLKIKKRTIERAKKNRWICHESSGISTTGSECRATSLPYQTNERDFGVHPALPGTAHTKQAKKDRLTCRACICAPCIGLPCVCRPRIRICMHLSSAQSHSGFINSVLAWPPGITILAFNLNSANSRSISMNFWSLQETISPELYPYVYGVKQAFLVALRRRAMD